MSPPGTALLAGGSLVLGFAVAELTGVRALGGVVLLVAAAVCAALWRRDAGTPAAVGLLVLYVAAFALSHLLARVVGAWPAVLTVAAGVALASLTATCLPVLSRSRSSTGRSRTLGA